jgi:tetratricopeptide (TPR) repeat protein
LSAYPDNALLLTMVAETYSKLGRHREASELLSDAIEKDPGFSTARWRLGTLLVMQGRQGDGLAQVEKAVELAPFSPRPYSELAGVYMWMRKTRLARRYMDKAEQLDPLDIGLIQQHAEWLESAGDLPRAVRRYRRVLELSPASPPAALELAWRLAISTDESVRNPPEALRLAQDAASRNGEPKSLVVLAAAYAANGSFDEAMESVDRALAEARQLGDPGLVDYLTRQRKRYGSKLPWSMAQETEGATEQNF